MAAKQIKAKLKAAKVAISEKQHDNALEICQEVLELDPESYHALVFAGKCSFELGERKESKSFYRRATAANDGDVLAWKGLSDFYDKTDLFTTEDKKEALEVYERFGKFIESDHEKTSILNMKMAALHKQTGNFDRALELLSVLTEDEANEPKFLRSCWEMLVSIKLYRKNFTISDFEQVTKGLRVLEGVEPNTARRRQCVEIARKLFLTTEEPSVAELILDTLSADLPPLLLTSPSNDAGDASTCVSILAQMLLCRLLKSYPLQPSSLGSLKAVVERMEGLDGGRGGPNLTLCAAVQLACSPTVLPSGLEMISSEGFSSALAGAVRSLLHLRMHAYPQARSQAQLCMNSLSTLPICWQKNYTLSFRMMLAECSAYEGEWSAAVGMLSDLSTEVDPVYRQQHVSPLVARIHLDRDELDRAEEVLNTLDPEAVSTMNMQAELMTKRKEFSSAVDVLQRALEKMPSSSTSHYLLGAALLLWNEGGRRQDAYKHLVKAASLDPHHSNTYYRLGQYFEPVTAGGKSRAVQCYKKAVDRSPSNEPAAKALASLLSEKKKDGEEELLALYKTVTSSCSMAKSGWAWRRMGLLQKETAQFSDALASFFKVLKAEPADVTSWECIAESYFDRGSYDSALKAFSKALELNPQSLHCKTGLARTKTVLGKMADACKDFEEVLAEDQSCLLALKSLGHTHFLLARQQVRENFDGQAVEHVQSCLDCLVKAAKLKPGFSSLWKGMADAMLCLVEIELDVSPWKLTVPGELTGDEPQVVGNLELLEIATKLYYQVCRLVPESSCAWHDLAVCLYHRAKLVSDEEGMRSSAVEAMKKATRLAPMNNQHWSALGVMATTLGPAHFALAQDAFVKSLNIDENDASAWTSLGLLYLKADNVSLARDCFKRALSADSAHQPAWACQARVLEIVAETTEALDMYRHAITLEYSDEAVRRYSQLVCESLIILPSAPAPAADGCGVGAARMSSVLRASCCLDKYMLRHPSDAVALNLSGLLCENEGLLSRATDTFQRALECLNSEDDVRLRKIVTRNLARVLVSRKDPDMCDKAVQLYANQIECTDHVTLAYRALAHHRALNHEQGSREFARLCQSCAEPDRPVLLAAHALSLLLVSPVSCKDLLFQAFQTPPPCIFSLIGLISFGVLTQEFTLAMAALEELVKLGDWSSKAMHPNNIDVLFHVKICLFGNEQGADLLRRVDELWCELKKNGFHHSLLTKKEFFISVLEQRQTGNLDAAKLSAAKYYHDFPSDVDLVPFILDTLQLIPV